MPIAVGPWIWREENLGRDGFAAQWEPPVGYGGLDLRKRPETGIKGGTPGLGVFWGEGNLPSEYAVLGDSWNALATRSSKDAIAQAAGNALLSGHTLQEALWDLLTGHADPDGFDAPCPLMPERTRLELHAGSELRGEQFRFHQHPHTDLVIAVKQREIARYHEQDPEHTRRILDKLCEELRIPKDRESFQRLVPPELRGEITELLPHRTTWSETWPNSESVSAGNDSQDQDQTWRAIDFQVTITGGSGAALVGTGATGMARCATALSGADHEIATGHTSTTTVTSRHSGPAVRYDASANTCYFASQAGGGSSNGTYRPAKLVAGTVTLLGTGSTQAQVATRNCSISGSTLAIGINGTETESISDSSITGGVRCGMVWINIAAQAHRCTGATASDLSAPSDDRDVSGSLTLPALTLSGAVEATVPKYEATGELTLPPLSLTSAVEAQIPTYEVIGTLVLPALTLSGEATRTLPEGSVAGALVLPALTLSGAAEATVPEYDVSGTLTLPALTLSGDVDRTLPEGAVVGSLTLPSLVLSGLVEAEVPEFDTSGTLVLPALTLSGTVVVGVVPEPPVEPGAVSYQYWWWIGQGGGVMESALTLCPGLVTMEAIGPGLSSMEPIGPGSIEIERVC